jgi:hypothetical protein
LALKKRQKAKVFQFLFGQLDELELDKSQQKQRAQKMKKQKISSK